MPDKISKLHRSWVMSRVGSRNTKPELIARSLLHNLGYRFTVNGPHNKKLPGKPDIVLPKYRTVVFVHGCFWHRHPNCKIATTPKSNQDYWLPKFRKNVERDRRNQTALQKAGFGAHSPVGALLAAPCASARFSRSGRERGYYGYDLHSG